MVSALNRHLSAITSHPRLRLNFRSHKKRYAFHAKECPAQLLKPILPQPPRVLANALDVPSSCLRPDPLKKGRETWGKWLSGSKKIPKSTVCHMSLLHVQQAFLYHLLHWRLAMRS